MEREDPLKEWMQAILWFRVLDGPLLELTVWHLAGIAEDERVALLAKHAAQGVRIIRQLTGTQEAIAQGGYKSCVVNCGTVNQGDSDE